jgi:hyperosmotically inducible protein
MSEHSNEQDRSKMFNPQGVKLPMNQDLHLVEEIRNALLTQTESAGIDIKVSAEGDAVRLHGVVDLLSHKTAAERIAAGIPGVMHVDNDITVADEEWKTDKHLQESITEKLTHNGRIKNMGAVVHRGVVQLVGHADTHENMTLAKKIVEDMPGVRELRFLQVKVGENRSEDDGNVSRAAEASLARLGYDPETFQVYADAGTLYVRGIVPTKEDKSRIKTEMHHISGVFKLVTTLVPEEQMGGEIH